MAEQARDASTDDATESTPTPIDDTQGSKRLFIVDGTSYIFRAYYASSPLSTRDGIPTNAVLIFTNMLLALLREHEPDFVAVAFDPPGDNFRHELYPEYKANRKERPEKLLQQVPYCAEIVRGLDLPALEIEGYEADDVIATLVDKARARGFDVTIVSGDKDLMQLVEKDHVRMLDTMGRMDRVFRIGEVKERFGVTPDKVADVLGLAGDSSDNIPGVPGVGIKTARKLVAQFGSLEGVLANIDEVSGKKRKENLETYADQARLSLELVTLDREVPLEFDPEHLRRGEPDLDTLLPLLKKLEFHRLSAEFMHEGETEVLPSDDDWASGAARKEYLTVLKDSELKVVLGLLDESERWSFQFHTVDEDPVTTRIVGISVAWQPHAAAYIPVAHRTLTAPTQLGTDHVLEALRSRLESPDVPKVCHNDKFHRIMLRRHEPDPIELDGIVCDTALASYLLDPSRRAHTIDALAKEVFEFDVIGLKEILGTGRKKRRFDHIDVETAEDYACERADLVCALAEQMIPLLEERELDSLHDEIELPLSRVLAGMELVGVRIDEKRLNRLSDELIGQMTELEARAEKLIGRRINLNSPKQLSEVLFDELEIEPVHKRKTAHGYSTDAAHLDALRGQHELVEVAIEYRTVSKLRSTYADNLPGLVNRDTDRIHTHFNQTVATTGRLSSSSPNLQNIPVRTEQGRRIRRAFVPRKGWKLLSADYSQIELRLMAHMSGDALLLEAFELGQDVHRRTAAEIFDVPIDEVTKAQRGAGKTINFGVLYGMGITRLAREIDVSRKEARTFLDAFDERFARVREFFDELVADATRDGYSSTLFGRRRYIPELRSRRRRQQSFGRRLAINTPIQGTAADLIKVAMIRVADELEQAGVRTEMLLQVHDELVFEVPPSELLRVTELVREQMEGVMRLDVDLEVDVSAGSNWADLEPM